MTTDPAKDFLTLAISNGAISATAVLGAAILSATALWFYNSSLAKNARKADYVREQIKNLYGPATFLLERGERAFTVHNRIMAGYEEYFKDRYGERFSQQMTDVLNVCNKYAQVAQEGNTEAVAIIKANWGWIDAEDGEAVRDFLTYVDRLLIELDEASKIRLPGEFYHSMKNSLDAPLIHDSTLVERFRKKLRQKQAELSGAKVPKPTSDTSATPQALITQSGRLRALP